MRHVITIGILFILAGCNHAQHGHDDHADAGLPADFGVNTNPNTENVIGLGNWSIVVGNDDPFDQYRGDKALCMRTAARAEYDGIEFDTGLCSHITVLVSADGPVMPGTQGRVIGWHSTLSSNEPSVNQGYIAIAIGETEVWSTQSEIPGPARTFDETFALPVEMQASNQLYIHVRNHGANTWNILRVEMEIERE